MTESDAKTEIFEIPIPERLPPGWKQIPNALMESMGGTPKTCPSFRNDLGMFVTITCSRELDGKKWLHLSCSYRDRVPSYYDLCDVKRIFLGDDGLAYLLFPPKSEHVNIHPNCLHLWSCLDGRVTPDFTHGVGTI